MPLSHKKELAASLLAASLALPLASNPGAYTQINAPILLGSAVGAAPAFSVGFTVAMPVSGVQDQAIKLHKQEQPRKKHAGS